MRLELDLRSRSVKQLRLLKFDAIPVENKLAFPGTPDINAAKLGLEYWVEVKIYTEWPKKEKTKIKIPHFTQKQKTWLWNRISHNKNCFILIQIEEEYFLYKVTGYVIQNFGSNWNQEEMRRNSTYRSKSLKDVLMQIQV